MENEEKKKGPRGDKRICGVCKKYLKLTYLRQLEDMGMNRYICMNCNSYLRAFVKDYMENTHQALIDDFIAIRNLLQEYELKIKELQNAQVSTKKHK